MINKNEYINFSGGSYGADLTWDKLGREYGFHNHLHFRPNDYHEASEEIQSIIDIAVHKAALALGRPEYFDGIDLVRRNWFQAAGCEAMFAISRLIKPNQYDGKHKNRTGVSVVSGGTGWAVEMAIQMDKPVYVFDLNTMVWYRSTNVGFEMLRAGYVPQLSTRFAGVGTRQLTSSGIIAIRQCYQILAES